jgi:diguanylate cyclase (GGDEF)-like protein
MSALAEAPTGGAAPAPGPPLRVLAVEDSAGYVALVRQLLAAAAPGEFELVVADRLSAAVERLLEEGIDCVLLDLGLPDADGFDALTHVRTAALDAPVVILSGSDDDELAVRAVREGAQDFLVKERTDGRLLARALRHAVERKRIENELARQALHDALTGLPNRALFFDRLVQALSRLDRGTGCLAVLFVDLDGFKAVNDSLGHPAGDRLLGEVAARLAAVLRAGDTAARYGGDEFLALCDSLSGVAEAERVAGRIARELERPYLLDGETLRVRVSVGVAVGCDGRDDPDALVRDADAAMYAVKSRGGGAFALAG